MPNNDYLNGFEIRIAEHRKRLLEHSIYSTFKDLQSVRHFMKFHVFAVWDFMSLLKSLQRSLTCIEIPWLPSKDALLTRFINEIVLAEESDEALNGSYLSHFELYLRAMEEVGADSGPISDFINRVRSSSDFPIFLKNLSAQGGVFKFMNSTFKQIDGESHEVAAAFLFGREDIIPEMFSAILKRLDLFDDEKYRFFRRYLERHIEVDGDHHGPLARKMLVSLCGNSATKWRQAETAAIAALEARIELWNFIATARDADSSKLKVREKFLAQPL